MSEPVASSSTDPLSGHLGHLDEHQAAQLEAFRAALLAEGLYRPALPGSTGVGASHDEGTLLRFLRARRFVVGDAVGQFRDTERWRARNRMDALYGAIGVRDYAQTRRLYPQWTGRRDRRGIPLYVFKVAALDAATMHAYTAAALTTASTLPPPDHSGDAGGAGGFWAHKEKEKETPARMLRLFALYENLTRFVMPLCSAAPGRPHPESPITQSNNIVDISGVGLRQFWNLRAHMQDASTLATAHYPETLDRIFIIGAPSFFPTVWGWIKKWFDPITTSKIFILPSSTTPEIFAALSEFIDPDCIPVQYGGTLEYEFGEMPKLDAVLASMLEWTDAAPERTLPEGPVLWERNDDDGRWEAVSVGSEDGVNRRVVIARLAPGIRMYGEEPDAP